LFCFIRAGAACKFSTLDSLSFPEVRTSYSAVIIVRCSAFNVFISHGRMQKRWRSIFVMILAYHSEDFLYTTIPETASDEFVMETHHHLLMISWTTGWSWEQSYKQASCWSSHPRAKQRPR